MSVFASSNRFSIDALTVLRAPGLGAVTATTASASLTLDTLIAYWNAGDNANLEEFAVEVILETTPVGTVVINLDIGVDTGFATMVTLESRTVTNSGRYTFALTREQLHALAGATVLRANLVLSGSTPSVAFNVYVSPLVG